MLGTVQLTQEQLVDYGQIYEVKIVPLVFRNQYSISLSFSKPLDKILASILWYEIDAFIPREK